MAKAMVVENRNTTVNEGYQIPVWPFQESRLLTSSLQYNTKT